LANISTEVFGVLENSLALLLLGAKKFLKFLG